MLRGKEEKITFSKGLGSECRKAGISIKEKAFADLLALGWKDKDAYLISGLYNPVYNLEINKKNMNILLSDDKDFMDNLTSASRKIKRRQKESEKEDDILVDGISEEDIASELSKENQLRKLIAARKKYDGKEGCKEWIDLTKMIADITQIKKDEIKRTPQCISICHFHAIIAPCILPLKRKPGSDTRLKKCISVIPIL